MTLNLVFRAGKNFEKVYTQKFVFLNTLLIAQDHRHVCEINEQILKFTKKNTFSLTSLIANF